MRRLWLLSLVMLGCSSRGSSSQGQDARAWLARCPSLAAGRTVTIEREGDLFVTRGGRAKVTLPRSADGAAIVESGVRVDVRLRGARPVAGEIEGGWIVYPGAVAGGAVFQRPDPDGTEDHVFVPSARTLVYDVDVHGAFVRSLDGVVEVLDAGGAPRVRMRAPTLIDAQGEQHAASVEVSGCPVDRSAAAPWGRHFRAAERCTISIAWDPMLPHPVLVDPAWTTTSSMSSPRAHHRAVRLASGKVLVTGGYHLLTLSTAELFDPTTATWASAGAMSIARAEHAMATAGAPALVAGAAPPTGTTVAELYDETSGWSTTGALLGAVTSASAIDLGAKVLLVGGGSSSSMLYDVTSGTWSASGAMSVARSNVQLHRLSTGAVWAYDDAHTSAEWWSAGVWTAVGSSSTNHGSSALLPGDRVMVFGGVDPASASTATEEWSASGWKSGVPAKAAFSLGVPAELPTGGVVVTGGIVVGSVLATAAQFDGTAWTALHDMAVARYDHTATALADGRVLVAGGSDGTNALASAEILGPLAAGSACLDPTDCASGVCAGGFCCTSACAAATCDGSKVLAPTCTATGACSTTTTDCAPYACASGACKTTCAVDADCADVAYCSGTTCATKKELGVAATSATECKSGVVADGVCCDKACEGVCESCATGTCAPKAGAASHGSCPAPGADPCSAASCDGADGKACKKLPGKETTCRAASCEAGVETSAAQCDGSGACPAATTKACGLYACDGPSCRRTCRSDLDCAKTASCDEISHECVPAETCDGDHTITAPSGTSKDCTPYKCEGKACLDKCSSSSECVDGYVCDTPSKTCIVANGTPATGDDGGGCSYGGPSRFSGVWLVAACVALVTARRRGLHSRSCASSSSS
jgi:hypothetical protein